MQGAEGPRPGECLLSLELSNEHLQNQEELVSAGQQVVVVEMTLVEAEWLQVPGIPQRCVTSAVTGPGPTSNWF